jgi:hypothetical protein
MMGWDASFSSNVSFHFAMNLRNALLGVALEKFSLLLLISFGQLKAEECLTRDDLLTSPSGRLLLLHSCSMEKKKKYLHF